MGKLKKKPSWRDTKVRVMGRWRNDHYDLVNELSLCEQKAIASLARGLLLRRAKQVLMAHGYEIHTDPQTGQVSFTRPTGRRARRSFSRSTLESRALPTDLE